MVLFEEAMSSLALPEEHITWGGLCEFTVSPSYHSTLSEDTNSTFCSHCHASPVMYVLFSLWNNQTATASSLLGGLRTAIRFNFLAYILQPDL